MKTLSERLAGYARLDKERGGYNQPTLKHWVGEIARQALGEGENKCGGK